MVLFRSKIQLQLSVPHEVCYLFSKMNNFQHDTVWSFYSPLAVIWRSTWWIMDSAGMLDSRPKDPLGVCNLHLFLGHLCIFLWIDERQGTLNQDLLLAQSCLKKLQSQLCWFPSSLLRSLLESLKTMFIYTQLQSSLPELFLLFAFCQMSFTLRAKLDTTNYEQCIIAGTDRPTHDNNHLESSGSRKKNQIAKKQS